MDNLRGLIEKLRDGALREGRDEALAAYQTVLALLDQPSAERAVVMAFALHLDMLRGTATPLRAGNHVSEAEAWLRVRAVLAASPPEPTNG
jgi:hypothetical protein